METGRLEGKKTFGESIAVIQTRESEEPDDGVGKWKRKDSLKKLNNLVNTGRGGR